MSGIKIVLTDIINKIGTLYADIAKRVGAKNTLNFTTNDQQDWLAYLGWTESKEQ